MALVLRRLVFSDELTGVFGPGERLAALILGVDDRPIALVRSLTVRKVPRRIAWRVMIPKKIILSLAVCGRADLGGCVEDGDLDVSAAGSRGPV